VFYDAVEGYLSGATRPKPIPRRWVHPRGKRDPRPPTGPPLTGQTWW